VVEERLVRFRTLGCYPLTGAIESDADTLEAIVAGDADRAHLRAPGPPDRHGRGGSMEKKKREGYF
jgi:sulfate adenylyltransferase subunit 2